MYYSVESLFEFTFLYKKPCSLEVFFRGIEVARFPRGLSLSQRKYFTDLLKEISIL